MTSSTGNQIKPTVTSKKIRISLGLRIVENIVDNVIM